MASELAPSTANYSLFKANVYFEEEGTSGLVHMGNAPSAELSFEFDELEHFSSMEGINELDLTVIRSKSANLVIEFEEFPPDNVSFFTLGAALSDNVIDILAVNDKTGRVQIVGSNDVGVKLQWDFPRVQWRPSGAIPMVTDEIASVEMTGKVLKSAGSFGTVVEI